MECINSANLIISLWWPRTTYDFRQLILNKLYPLVKAMNKWNSYTLQAKCNSYTILSRSFVVHGTMITSLIEINSLQFEQCYTSSLISITLLYSGCNVGQGNRRTSADYLVNEHLQSDEYARIAVILHSWFASLQSLLEVSSCISTDTNIFCSVWITVIYFDKQEDNYHYETLLQLSNCRNIVFGTQ